MSTADEGSVVLLQSWFPDIDTDVIVAVLDSNGGDMHRTAAQLGELAPTPSASTTSSSRRTPAPSDASRQPAGTTVTSSIDLSTGLVTDSRQAAAAAAPGGPARGRWRHPLPDDFLRVPGAGQPVATSTPSDQITQDMLLAQMMEDELFLQELRQDPEFARYLEAESDFFRRGGDAIPSAQGSSQSRRRSGSQTSATTGTSWTAKLASMGDEMKRKFNSLAMRFRKSGGAEPTQDPMQYRSLLVDGGDDDDDDDDEGATEVVLRADAPVTRRPVASDTAAAPATSARTSSTARPKKDE